MSHLWRFSAPVGNEMAFNASRSRGRADTSVALEILTTINDTDASCTSFNPFTSYVYAHPHAQPLRGARGSLWQQHLDAYALSMFQGALPLNCSSGTPSSMRVEKALAKSLKKSSSSLAYSWTMGLNLGSVLGVSSCFNRVWQGSQPAAT